MTRTDVEFAVRGTRIAAWYYRPDGVPDTEPLPCLVMAHGFSAVRDQRLPAFAERFAAAGYSAVVFDYRYFGDSDGEPRQVLDVTSQLADWRAAIGFARRQPGVDPDTVVVWGTSFSGGYAISLAAADHRLAAAIAQGPFADGLTNLLSYGPRQGSSLLWPALRDQLRGLTRRPPLLIPAVGDPGSGAIVVSPDAVSGFGDVTPPDSSWRNEVAARIGLHIAFYRPVRKAARIRCPILLCVATRDVITPPAGARRVADRAPRAELKEYDAQHFQIYVGETFGQVIADQLDFLGRHVPAPAVRSRHRPATA